jgi:hypothetical protein
MHDRRVYVLRAFIRTYIENYMLVYSIIQNINVTYIAMKV